jgi:hypothetical protein
MCDARCAMRDALLRYCAIALLYYCAIVLLGYCAIVLCAIYNLHLPSHEGVHPSAVHVGHLLHSEGRGLDQKVLHAKLGSLELRVELGPCLQQVGEVQVHAEGD